MLEPTFWYLVITWWPMLALLARLTGWHTLAQQYPLHPAQRPARWQRWISGRVAEMYIQGGLQIAVQHDGLSIRPIMLFRPGFPPLHIPWHAIRAVDTYASLFGEVTQLRVRGRHASHDVPISIPSHHLKHLPTALPAAQRRQGSAFSWRIYLYVAAAVAPFYVISWIVTQVLV